MTGGNRLRLSGGNGGFLLALFVFADLSEQCDLLNARRSDVGKDVTAVGMRGRTRRGKTRWFREAKKQNACKTTDGEKENPPSKSVVKRRDGTLPARDESNICRAETDPRSRYGRSRRCLSYRRVAPCPRTAFIEKRTCHLYPRYANTTALSPHINIQ